MAISFCQTWVIGDGAPDGEGALLVGEVPITMSLGVEIDMGEEARRAASGTVPYGLFQFRKLL